MLLALAAALSVTAAPELQVSLVKMTATSNQPAITKELKAQLGSLEGCYDLALKGTPSLRGAMTVLFVLDVDIGLTSISATEDSVKDDTLVSCVLARLRFGEWPKPKKPTSVSATIRFEQKSR